MVNKGAVVLVAGIGIVVAGLVARELTKPEDLRPDRLIEQNIKSNSLGSSLEWQFLVTYKNKTNEQLEFEGILQAQDCVGNTISLQFRDVLLLANDEKTLRYTLLIDPNVVQPVSCNQIQVEFFIIAPSGVALGAKKTVSINF